MVTRLREEFPDARHHCSAFVVWQDGAAPIQHSSDDGEPSGTAGRPMLDVLTGAGLSNVCAVVVRYFGGTLLGTGGLVRAYSDAVSAVLAELPVVRAVRASLWELALPYADAGRVESELRGRDGFDVVQVTAGATGQVVRFASVDDDALAAAVAGSTRGTGELVPAGSTMREEPIS